MSESCSSTIDHLGTYGYGTFQDNTRELARLNFQAKVAWPIERAMLGRHGLTPQSRVLDVACGTGEVTCRIAAVLKSGSVLGVELNDSLLNIARERAIDTSGKNVAFRKGNVYSLNRTDKFDFAYARFLFQHLNRPLTALRSIRNTVRPGGRVLLVDVDDRDLICVPGNSEFSDFLADAARYQKQNGGNRMIGRALPELARQAGFCDIREQIVKFDSDQLGLDQFLELTTSFKLEQFAPKARAQAEQRLSAVIAQLRSKQSRLQVDIHCVSGARAHA